MENPQLYMCLIGCKPKGRHIEQHDIFFTIADNGEHLKSQMQAFWPDGGKLHVDAWRKVTRVDGYEVKVIRHDLRNVAIASNPESRQHLYFINLGGYQPGYFEEFHYKLLTVQPDKSGAIKAAKQTSFFKEATSSHIDDQYGVDIDDLYNVEDILPVDIKQQYCLSLQPAPLQEEDKSIVGYTKWDQISKLI